jgi:hypothetical protein
VVIVRGDALDLLDHVEPGSVQCCVTSPPYWGLRTYGDDDREGGRQDLHAYLAWLVQVLDGVRLALAADGALWVNIGDTAAGSGGAGGDYVIPSAAKRKRRKAPIERREYRQGRATVATGRVPRELARRCIGPSTDPGDLVLDPFMGSGTVARVAEAMGRRAIGLDLYADDAGSTTADEVGKPEAPQVTDLMTALEDSVTRAKAARARHGKCGHEWTSAGEVVACELDPGHEGAHMLANRSAGVSR